MANKKITDLQLRDNISDDLNFPSDDSLQSYRVTAEQFLTYVKQNIMIKKLIGTTFGHNKSTAPTYALACDGSAVSRTTYADLFGVIGTTFGTGDGSTTFNIPNFSGLYLRGTGNQSVNGRTKTGPALGAVEEDQMQGHKHSMDANGPWMTPFPGGGGDSGGGAAAFAGGAVGSPTTDGTNGTPRTGAETRVSGTGQLWCIWALPIPLEDV